MSVLDLDRIDQMDLKNPDDVEELGRMVDDCYHNAQSYLNTLAMIWEQNIRFFMGEQHIRYSQRYRRYEPIPETKYNAYIPRPVTNYILPAVQTLVSIYTKQKPNASVRPNSTDTKDTNCAKLSERIQDEKWESDHEQINHITAALILLLCGTVIRKDYWDSGAGPVDQTPLPEEMGGGILGPVGDSAVEIIDPFRFIPDIQNQSWFIETNIKPISWVKTNYNQQGEGFTGLAAEVKEDDDLSNVMTLFNKLKTATGINSSSGSESRDSLKGCTIVKECYIQPTPNHPKGIMIARASKKTLYVSDSPYYDSRYTDSWHPYTFCKFQVNPFRWHGLSLVEHLIDPQKHINAIDALIVLNRRTMAIPQWLVPVGSMQAEGYISGEPGLNIPYSPVGANGARPEKLQAAGLAADVYREREEKVKAISQISGMNEVLSGIRPEGVNTAAAMNMLLEQSFSKFNPFIQGWEKFIEEGQSKKLILISTRYKEPRPEFIKRLKALNKDDLDVEIVDFLGSSLQDNVSVRIEAGSSLPRSKVVEQQTMQELARGGLFGPLDPMQNPVGNEEFLEKFGVAPLTTELNADVKRARWINGVLTAINRGEMGPENQPPILPFDNLMIHEKILTDRMKSPNFKDEFGLFQQRLQEITMIKQQQMMEQQMQQQNLAPQEQSRLSSATEIPAPVGPSNLQPEMAPALA